MFGFVVHEAALRTKVGGREGMRQQLLHLPEIGGLRNVSLQVLPSGKCGGLAQVHGMIRMQAFGVEESAAFIRKVAEEP
ncbi:Scr1 family TA system antitoxin-like transcriptional regulator [Streptomyces olivochromogenes]|uniref:DUF5753 domain-containing protein n=1 Tax=Streptomyces olivochromogenes TaxID=1963 RepID=A0A250VN42_STROL|nr:hypothetical protein AQJ27_39285 [Streptomyces olivochromogenes]GAX55486.1 hypothetical protein SO3561_07044 [Streptomyces olivochromogenes]